MKNINSKTWSAGEINPDVQIGNIVEKYDRTFEWTRYHLTGKELNILAQQGDPLADAALPFLESKGKSRIESMEALVSSIDCPAEVKALYDQVNAVPEWVDFNQIARGQEFFWRNFYYAILVLQTHSLVSDFTVSSIVGVLTCTGYLGSPKSTYRRSIETAYMVTSSMERNQLKPGGNAWHIILNTRLMHSQARRHVNRVINRDIQKVQNPIQRLPINQEDLLFTLMLFSIVILQDFERLKIPFTSQQKEDYLATFRYIGYLIGITDFENRLENYEKCLALKQSLDMHLVQPNEQSSPMAQVVLQSFHNTPPFYIDHRHLIQMARFLMCDKLGNELGFPHANSGLDWSFKLSFGFRVLIHKILLWSFPSGYLSLLEFKVIEGYRDLLRGPPAFQFKEFNESDDFSVNLPFRLMDYSHFLIPFILLFIVLIYNTLTTIKLI